MTNEEMQSAIHFIVDQQAKMVANQMKADERMTNIENVVLSLANTVEKVADTQADIKNVVLSLANTVGKVADAQAETNERLNSLINVVERFISEGRNGKP
jgi:ABC-type transporter Mla subunit MlaD